MNRRELIRGGLAAGAGAMLEPIAAVAADGKEEFHGPHPAVHRLLVLQCGRREVERREDLPGCQGTEVQVGRDRRSGRLGHPEEAWAGLRHRSQRHARRPVHEGLQQPEISRRGDRANEEKHRCLRRGRLSQRDRLHRLQVARRRRSQERRNHPRGRCRQLRQGVEGDRRLRREEEGQPLPRAPEHARWLAPHEGASGLPGRRPGLPGRHHPPRRLAAAASCSSTSTTSRSCTAT